jgi:hypothetical protein
MLTFLSDGNLFGSFTARCPRWLIPACRPPAGPDFLRTCARVDT